jgi:ABC-type Mn2+/Zn2+ transport system ATPase subunit
MAGKLPLLTLDSPTQNMDDTHKEAFAKLLSRLTEEFQVIVATENIDTKDYIMANSADATLYELGDWGTEGPQVSSSP